MKYQVIVGNVGTVLDTDNGYVANREYGQWVAISKRGLGRAGNEPVTLMCEGEVKFEHEPTWRLYEQLT